MISETLSMWGNGAVTLPKKWRAQFPTKHFVASEVPQGLLIRPILDIEYYEEKDGTVGLRFPSGMDMDEFLELFRKASKKIDDEERNSKKKIRNKSRKK